MIGTSHFNCNEGLRKIMQSKGKKTAALTAEWGVLCLII